MQANGSGSRRERQRLGRLTQQVAPPDVSRWAQWSPPSFNCLGACQCSAAMGRASVLGPFLAPSEVAGSSVGIHDVIHKLRDDQNRLATFSAEHKPGVEIESGEVFSVQCLCASGGWVTREGVPSPGAVATGRAHSSGGLRYPGGSEEELRYKASQGLTSGNPVCEPVYVRGAEPGDTLQVDVLKLRTADFGWTCVRPSSALLEASVRSYLGDDPTYDDPSAIESGRDAPRVFIWDLHPDTGDDCELRLPDGRTLRVPYMPFCGVMGVAPPPARQLEAGYPRGVVSVGPPNINGGNMDNRHMREGSTLFYPVFVKGALFSCGDGHAAQGDGEVAGTAIETAMHCTMRLTVIKKGTPGNPGGRLPRYITPGPVYKPGGPQFGTTGVDSSMVAAARTALHEMIDYLGTVHGLSSYEALVLCSVAADFKIVEVVDMPNYVVSMHLPLAVLPAP